MYSHRRPHIDFGVAFNCLKNGPTKLHSRIIILSNGFSSDDGIFLPFGIALDLDFEKSFFIYNIKIKNCKTHKLTDINITL